MGQQISPTPNTKENHLYAEDGDFNSELYQNYGKLWAKNIILNSSGTLVNNVSCTLNNNGILNNSWGLVNDGGMLNNNSGGTLNIISDRSMLSNNIGGTLNNNGTLNNYRGGTLNNNGVIDNSENQRGSKGFINKGIYTGTGVILGSWTDYGTVKAGNSAGGMLVDGHYYKKDGSKEI